MNHEFLKSNAKKISIRFILLSVLSFCIIFSGFAAEKKIDLSGKWSVKLDSADIGISQKWFLTTFSEKMDLPGTTDDAQMGIPNTLLPKLEKPQILHLTRKNSYVGVAWYSRSFSIPADWKNKQITLKLERVIWQTRVWIDGKEVPTMQESLTTPHYFDLSKYLPAGNHKITIRVDNRKKYDISVNDMAHAYTNETQIMWNGIIGEISCTSADKIHISDIQIYPDIDKKLVRVKVSISNSTDLPSNGVMKLFVASKKIKLTSLSFPFHTNKSTSIVEMTYPMGKNPLLWDEFNPNLYTLSAEIKGKGYQSTKTATFGMRSLTNKNAHIQVNGHDIFLRGTLECSIFPLTGHPPMDKQGWQKVFGTAREWGLNHLRFHSWCPPEAAFEVADEMGFYLQIELPLWSLTVNKDKATNEFLYAEANRISTAYGNHPSFCFWSLGNELQPDFKFLNAFVDKLKSQDSRHLYTCTSYTFEKGHGDWPEHNDDYFITQYTKKGWVRGQGIFGSESPRFDKDYSTAIDSIPVPIITHEIGQYSVYPNVKEIDKYTGVLDPLNFKAVKADLQHKNLLNKATDYLMASGQFAAILYKEEIERALKTKGLSGFQLLDLQDYPGQGTALVGLVDAFWDSKGIISPTEFREFCASVVPLARFPKAVFLNNETFHAELELANYSNEEFKGKKAVWELTDKSGKVLKTGFLIIHNSGLGNVNKIGDVSCPLSFAIEAKQLKFSLKIEDTAYQNSWKLWVYPVDAKPELGNVVYTRVASEAEKALAQGKTVLYNPDWKKLKGIEGKFLPVFWSPVHFPKQAATMGVLCNPNDPALAEFPTDMHSDWQWWDLNTNSTTLVIDSIPQVHPIVEMIDNWVNNRRLASVFEAKVGNGKLLYSTIDLNTNLDHRPQAKQMLISLLDYMNSPAFHPSGKVPFSELLQFESEVSLDKKTQATDIY